MNKTIEKLLAPSFDYNETINSLTPEEKLKLIKNKFNLHHGKGKRKKKNRKR